MRTVLVVAVSALGALTLVIVAGGIYIWWTGDDGTDIRDHHHE